MRFYFFFLFAFPFYRYLYEKSQTPDQAVSGPLGLRACWSQWSRSEEGKLAENRRHGTRNNSENIYIGRSFGNECTRVHLYI